MIYAGAAHPWNAAVRREADSPELGVYDPFAKDPDFVIMSHALVRRAGCIVWRTKANAYLIDREIPAEAIVAVDIKRREGKQTVIRRFCNRIPESGIWPIENPHA